MCTKDVWFFELCELLGFEDELLWKLALATSEDDTEETKQAYCWALSRLAGKAYRAAECAGPSLLDTLAEWVRLLAALRAGGKS